jgi:hypothetical protein
MTSKAVRLEQFHDLATCYAERAAYYRSEILIAAPSSDCAKSYRTRSSRSSRITADHLADRMASAHRGSRAASFVDFKMMRSLRDSVDVKPASSSTVRTKIFRVG